jgi:hypothetical protein
MAKYIGQDGVTEVEIGSLQEKDEVVRVDNRADFEKLVIAQGFRGVTNWEATFGMKAEEVIGKWFGTMGSSIWIE